MERRINKDIFFQNLFEIARKYSETPPQFSSKEREDAIKTARKHGANRVLNEWEKYQQKKPGKPFAFFIQDVTIHEEKKEVFERCPLCYRKIRAYDTDCPRCGLSKKNFNDEEEIINYFESVQDRIRTNCAFINQAFIKRLRDEDREKTDEQMRKFRIRVIAEIRQSYPWNREKGKANINSVA